MVSLVRQVPWCPLPRAWQVARDGTVVGYFRIWSWAKSEGLGFGGLMAGDGSNHVG